MLFDEIYVEIGEFKLGQILIYVILMLTAIFAGFHHVSITFLAAELPHWCHVTELQNLTFDRQKLIAVPDTNGEYDQCKVFDFNYSAFTTDEFLNWDRDTRSQNASTRKCDTGWVYDRSVFKLTAVNQWDLVCDNAYKVSLIQTVYMAGVMVGCLLFGQISDSIGRIKTISVCCFFWTGFAIAAAFVPEYAAFVTLRFFVGALAAGAYTTSFVLCMEIIGQAYRMETGIFVQAWFAVGFMVLSGLSFAVRDFVTLQLIIGILPIFGITFYWLVPESPRWLVSHHKDAEAEQVLQLIADLNNTKLPAELHLEDNRQGHKDEEKAVLIDLFKTSRMRLFTICMWIAWLSTSVVYYGLSLGVSLLEGSLFFNNFLSGVVEIPSYVFSIIALRYVGRRWPTIVTFILAGLFNLISIPFLEKDDQQTELITMMMLGKFFGAGCFAILYVYAAELFPTVVRNVGVGTSSMMARVGGLIQPQIALIERTWVPGPFLVYGVLSVIGALVSLVFPETRNKKLPETLEEAENFGKASPVLPETIVATDNLGFDGTPEIQMSKSDLEYALCKRDNDIINGSLIQTTF